MKGRTGFLLAGRDCKSRPAGEKSSGLADLLICPTKLAARAGKALLKRLESKGKYDLVINALDNDSPGEEATKSLLYYIGANQVGPVQRLELTRKDPCDELVKGKKHDYYVSM